FFFEPDVAGRGISVRVYLVEGQCRGPDIIGVGSRRDDIGAQNQASAGNAHLPEKIPCITAGFGGTGVNSIVSSTCQLRYHTVKPVFISGACRVKTYVVVQAVHRPVTGSVHVTANSKSI